MLTTRDAARLIGCSERAVRLWITQGSLPAATVRQGPRRVFYRVDPEQLGAWLRDVRPLMRGRGRPRRADRA